MRLEATRNLKDGERVLFMLGNSDRRVYSGRIKADMPEELRKLGLVYVTSTDTRLDTFTRGISSDGAVYRVNEDLLEGRLTEDDARRMISEQTRMLFESDVEGKIIEEMFMNAIPDAISCYTEE